jgi:hypothetical protein
MEAGKKKLSATLPARDCFNRYDALRTAGSPRNGRGSPCATRLNYGIAGT